MNKDYVSYQKVLVHSYEARARQCDGDGGGCATDVRLGEFSEVVATSGCRCEDPR